MRVYHILSAHWGITAIRNKRLKIARFADLNDPFELLGANLRNKNERLAFRRWKSQISEIYGLLCFSMKWHSPVLWSHYGDKHEGICLGFDVPDQKILPVNYQTDRISVSVSDLTEASLLEILSTKYLDWSYENEIRVITDLTDRDPVDQLYYADFGNELVLREVVVGSLCKLSRKEIESEIVNAGLDLEMTELTKARLAFKSFAIVPDKRGLK